MLDFFSSGSTSRLVKSMPVTGFGETTLRRSYGCIDKLSRLIFLSFSVKLAVSFEELSSVDGGSDSGVVVCSAGKNW